MNASFFPTMRTDKLLFRQITDDDIQNIFRGLSHPDVIKYYGVNFKTLEETTEQMKFFADLEKNGTGIWWAVCSVADGTFFGAGGLNNVSQQHKKGEIGFWLLPDFWGHGIMTEAIPLICNYGFNELGLHRIEGFVETENANCKRAMDKCGFTHEGTMGDCEIKDGRYISLDIYAMLR
jgi:ribosomal-protein-alanine N-acetyltransferase